MECVSEFAIVSDNPFITLCVDTGEKRKQKRIKKKAGNLKRTASAQNSKRFFIWNVCSESYSKYINS